MAKQNAHEALQEVRDKLVAQRRASVIKAAASTENFDGWWPDILKYQAAIDAIDRAIEDEKRLANKPYDISGAV